MSNVNVSLSLFRLVFDVFRGLSTLAHVCLPAVVTHVEFGHARSGLPGVAYRDVVQRHVDGHSS